MDAALTGNADLLKEMKRIKSEGRQRIPDHVDGNTGSDIADTFADVYEELYSSVDDKEGLADLQQQLQNAGINASDVDQITPEVVKLAVGKLQPGKTDVSDQFKSDVFLHAPDNLFAVLSSLFKAFFIHEDFTYDLLCCAFAPLLKGQLKDDTNSKNYRAIAISSLLLKILDNIILILWGHLLGSDWLQFGYKKESSGTQCTWMVLEVVSYYQRNDTSVKCATIDCTKAFDKCVLSTLFTKVLDRGVPAIIVRGLLAIYQKQRCWVRWTDRTVSREFGVLNSTRQGSCLSPCLFSVYLDELLTLLRDSGVGCFVGDLFTGAGCFADDLVLLSPTKDALQQQLHICQEYAAKHNLSFSTDPDPKLSKSKCVFFRQGREDTPVKVRLCGQPLPWVDTATHLGHELHYSGKQDFDCAITRAQFIGQSNEILNMFEFANPCQILTAVQTYACAWYGSCLWDLYGDAAGKAFRSWSTTVKMAYGLPRQCRTYIVDHLLSGTLPTVRQMIIRRYVQFAQKLTSSGNPVIWQLSNLAVSLSPP